MTTIKVFINNSSINNFIPSNEYSLTLSECIGCGSYGIIFKIKNSEYVIKILFDDNCFDEDITDFSETEVIDKMIKDKNIKVNCNQYATVFLKNVENQFPIDGPINIFVNNRNSPIHIDSIVFYKRKQIKFSLLDDYQGIIMPYFIPLNNIITDTSFIRNELFLCKILDLLIESTKELINLDFLNLDIKIANAVVDKDYNLRFIDFGIIKRIEKINDNHTNKTKYYIWPLTIKKYSQYLSYMIGIFIMEFYYEHIHRIKYNRRLLETIMNTFDTLETISNDVKKLLRNMLIDGIEWKNLVDNFNNIKNKYDIENVILPLYPSAML